MNQYKSSRITKRPILKSCAKFALIISVFAMALSIAFSGLPSAFAAGSYASVHATYDLAPTPTNVAPSFGSEGSQSVTYTASSATIPNPERGTEHTNTSCESDMYTVSQLQSYRTNDNMTLVLCNFYLTNFKTSAIDSETLTALQTQFTTIRDAGFKVILRFAYSSTDNVDADLSQVLAHIDQLAPIIQANSDIILLWQGSFVGEWGEGYYTSNYGDSGVISPQQWADRKTILDKQLAVLPATRMVSLRTPLLMTSMYDVITVDGSTAYNGSSVSRIGQHNDAFLGSPDDFGTYTDTRVDYLWSQAQTTYTPMGGETAASNRPRTDCPTALQEMSMFHWSYINVDWYPDVVNAWSTQGCLATMQQKLGYRFVMTQGTYPNTASVGGPLNVQISIRNDGYAAPFNPRNVELVLRNASSGTLYRFPLSTDPRLWLAGTTTILNQTIMLPTNIPAGTYALLVNLPDPITALSTRPEYSIQLANIGTWEASTGFNDLLKTVTVN